MCSSMQIPTAIKRLIVPTSAASFVRKVIRYFPESPLNAFNPIKSYFNEIQPLLSTKLISVPFAMRTTHRVNTVSVPSFKFMKKSMKKTRCLNIKQMTGASRTLLKRATT